MNCCDKSLTKPLLGYKPSKSQSQHQRRKRRTSLNNNSGENGYYCEDEIDLEPELDSDTQFAAMSNRGCSMTLRRIFLLLWKNFLFRRRHYIVTALEIILPTLFAMLLAYIKTQVPDFNSHLPSGKVNVTNFPRVPELDMRENVANAFGYYCTNCLVAFTPDNPQTRLIMEKVKAKLPKANFDMKGYDSEQLIEVLVSEIALNRSTSSSTLKAAIVFEKGLDKNTNTFASDQKLSYKIRLVDELTYTGELFPWFQMPGPNRPNVVNYVNAGFSGLQIALDKTLIELLTGKEPTVTIDTQGFPYPPYVQTVDFTQLYFIFLPQFIVLGFIFIVPSIIRNVVSEKETGIKELMKMMGLPNWMHWLGWMLNSMIVLVLSITIVVGLFFITFNKDSGPFLVYSDPTLWWFVLCLYAISATAFCFFISTFFQRPTLATMVGIVVWLVSYYGMSIPLDSKYQNMSLIEKMLSGLLPNMALHLVIKTMSSFEGKATGSHWYNIAEPINAVDELSVGHMCLMFILDTILYMCLTIYFENIIPSEFGVRKPWYYIFKPSTWIPRGKVNVSREASRVNSAQDGCPGFEAEQPGLTPGIIIQQLSKRFGRNKIAVDRVSLKMFDGQITALLGHNGAGKTTTMSMLTGMFAPTSGTAVVNGFDVNSQLDQVRSSLGLCPQHNMLFNKLTVEEHLLFFGRLKGLTSGQAMMEMKTLLEKLQLREKRKVLSMSLSGGQKRKLSLGMALIGGTKVVILDEPTSGMDPEARRAIWDILLEMRGQRTIVLTTHFMEEADVLGDRIAIMSAGKIKCCGSPMYLKRFYGAGYTLKMTVQPNSDSDLILYTVQKHVPSASFKSQQFSNSSEIGITLPSEGHSTSLFPPMFSDLQENKQALGILTIGLSLTTMDEVFVKVGEISNGDEEIDGTKSDLTPTKREGNSGTRTSLHMETATGAALVSEQIWALLLKRLIYTFRKRKLFISQFIIPLLLVITAIVLSNRSYHHSPSPPALKMSLKDYKNVKTLYSFMDETLADNYKSVVGSSAIRVDNVFDEVLSIGEKDLGTYRSLYVVGADLNSTVINALYSSIPRHGNPLSINLASNTILKAMASDKKYSIDVTNHPLVSGLYSIIEAAQPNPSFATVVPILFGVFIPIGLALFAASYIVFPVEEKLCKAKQLQLMTGVSPLIFWGSSFVWDFFLMAGLITIMLVCFPIFQSYGALTAYGGGGVIYLILLVYGFSAISFSYLCSTFVGTVPGGFSLVTIIHILTGMIMPLVVYLLEVAELGDQTTSIRLFGRLFPTFGVSLCMMRYTALSTKNSRCKILSQQARSLVCNPAYTVGPELRQCCENCLDFKDTGTTCFTPEPYLRWSYTNGGHETPDIGQDLLYLFLIGILYKCLILLVEYGLIQRLVALIFKSKSSTFTNVCNDEDVKAETQRVQSLVRTGKVGDDALVVDGLCKSYGSFAAVSNLSFGVHHGECFGLLGVNGAGKTTTFRMLTGDEIRSSGNAFSFNCALEQNRKKFLGSIGYCPQFDGIVGVLTGREMLELFSRLRGVPKAFVTSEADKWLYKMGLYESRNVQCQNYSGGMKRRLSAAMALIGDPPIVMLDEPTSGVDPVARRQFWKVISEVRDSGQAVILTSHSMEECEALCSRLGIMVNGQFQCMGGVQHLKNKFAQGFSLVLKLKPLIPPESPELSSLSADISNKFNPCVLKDQHQNVLNYQVFNTTIPWDVMFQTMEDLRVQYQDIIEDYAVNETTLEEVFLSFARKQYSNREANVSCIKKFITCQCCQ